MYRFFWGRTLIFKSNTPMWIYGYIVEMVHPCFEPLEYIQCPDNDE